jgi:hypothetical protein
MQDPNQPNTPTFNKAFIGKGLFYATLIVVCSGAYLYPTELNKIVPVVILALGAGFLAARVEGRKKSACTSRNQPY